MGLISFKPGSVVRALHNSINLLARSAYVQGEEYIVTQVWSADVIGTINRYGCHNGARTSNFEFVRMLSGVEKLIYNIED